MKKVFSVISALALLFAFAACTPEDKPAELIATGEALDITDYSVILTGYANLPLELAEAEVGIMYDVKESFEDAKRLVAKSLGGDNKFTFSIVGLLPGTTYFFKSYVQSGMATQYGAVKSFKTMASKCPAGAIDLGIVITRKDGSTYKLYWAESNLCENGLCAKPEDIGDFYAWGEIDPYYAPGHSQDKSCTDWRSRSNPSITGYNWESYKWCQGTSSTLTKYNTDSKYGKVDGITELQAEDDAASVKLGKKWRMPSNAEWIALYEQCTSEWVKDYKGTGVAGRIISAKAEGYEGKSIFLPATGYWSGKYYNKDSEGRYWSSSIDKDSPHDAYYAIVRFSSFAWFPAERPSGRNIRPVSE